MRVIYDIDEDHAWLREELEQAAEKALGEVASGGRPEYSAGYLKGVDDLAAALEARYDYHVRKSGPQEVQPDPATARVRERRKRA